MRDMDVRQDYYLTTMGIEVYQARAQVSKISPDWGVLKQKVATCTACDLHKGRTQTVFGVGDQQADLVVIGEAPGFHEDQQGEPFVGRAGQLLDEILQAIGLSRAQIYIANVLKCRPPQNRDPKMDEVQQCTPYLQQQLRLLQPKLIVATGRHAAHFLLDSKASLGALRGKTHDYQGIPLLVSYHTAYLLRNPADKYKAMLDWWQVAKKLKSIKNNTI